MSVEFQPVIGLEVHAVLETKSKMFCDCPVVDSTHDEPNSAVCPVCSGMPGVLPVINRAAVEYALRVALALDCQISTTSIFARKSYFYPDLPKGYQISQYEQPLARNGRLTIETSAGEQVIRVRRVHLEEDTGKLTHFSQNGEAYSLVDLNRSGIPLLEIVSEPDMHSVEAVRNYAVGLRSLLRYLGVNSGNLEKGLFRIEPNISIRPVGSREFGIRTEIKNLNSFRSLERGVEYEIERQSQLLLRGEQVAQETVGWDEEREKTFPQRSKEDADDYRYFPEPDLPPLVVDKEWIESVRDSLPELPHEKHTRFKQQYDLTAYDAGVLVAEKAVADYFEAVLSDASEVNPKMVANWISGDLFGLMNQQDLSIEDISITPQAFAELLQIVASDEINQNTAKKVLEEMLASGKNAGSIVEKRGLKQISDPEEIAQMVSDVLLRNSNQVAEYLAGKKALSGWLFGQVMQASKGKANPQVIRKELDQQLTKLDEDK
jgi:aspartyl-tRNA(Asn)/glutamyl-tRNA(Gln) amidotransferase subunit B